MPSGALLIDDIDSCLVPLGHAAFWWLGQHGFAIKLGQVVCYIDAFLTPLADRLVPPLLKPEEITNANLILGSHDHADHIDRKAWPIIAKASPQTRFIVPALLREKIVAELAIADDRVLGVDLDKDITVGDVTVTGIPAAHEFLEVDRRTGLHPYLGFVLESNGFRLYHAGDTCIYENMHTILRRWRFDLAMLPINGRDAKRLVAGCIGNMTYQEAADLAGSIRPGLTVPTHFEMFAMNREDPQQFLDYMRVKYPSLPAHIPIHGERILVHPMK